MDDADLVSVKAKIDHAAMIEVEIELQGKTMSIFEAVILKQEEVIEAYSQMLHALLDELSQHRNVDAEEDHLKHLDEKGGISK